MSFLISFKINVLGVDTPSIDPAQPPIYPCHMYLQPNNVPLMEYVANLDSIPVRNTTIVLGAMKVRDGTGGPTRVFAFIDEEHDDMTDSVGTIYPLVYLIFIMLCCLYM
jgi:kynurenine formamidase